MFQLMLRATHFAMLRHPCCDFARLKLVAGAWSSFLEMSHGPRPGGKKSEERNVSTILRRTRCERVYVWINLWRRFFQKVSFFENLINRNLPDPYLVVPKEGEKQ